jgi:hypothetical protein
MGLFLYQPRIDPRLNKAITHGCGRAGVVHPPPYRNRLRKYLFLIPLLAAIKFYSYCFAGIISHMAAEAGALYHWRLHCAEQ